jgi:hypothetical protein
MFDYLPFFDIFPTEITTKCRFFKNYNSVPKNDSVKILPRPLGEIPMKDYLERVFLRSTISATIHKPSIHIRTDLSKALQT